jgi:hypothetical protein
MERGTHELIRHGARMGARRTMPTESANLQSISDYPRGPSRQTGKVAKPYTGYPTANLFGNCGIYH